MHFFTQIEPMRQFLNLRRQQGGTIGFVPTMGALHQGHLSLVGQAKQKNTLAVCSIFVNPTQFNDPKDLERYPRTPDKDIEMLSGVGCDVIFMPEVEEIYPSDVAQQPPLDLGALGEVMEGRFRPGHFAGVAQVVERLLRIVEPNQLYMGQKDFQQVAIVRFMIKQLHLPVALVMSPTVREPDGLAMSSRNVRLSTEQRSIAPVIFRTLEEARHNLSKDALNVRDIESRAIAVLQEAGLRPEYFDIVNAETLQPVTPGLPPRQMTACVAAWLGEVRLIDNLLL